MHVKIDIRGAPHKFLRGRGGGAAGRNTAQRGAWLIAAITKLDQEEAALERLAPEKRAIYANLPEAERKAWLDHQLALRQQEEWDLSRLDPEDRAMYENMEEGRREHWLRSKIAQLDDVAMGDLYGNN